MPANIREKLIGFGKARQADIATANTVANVWRLNKLNTTFANPRLNTENDAAQHSEAGQLLRWAIDLRAALRLCVSLSLDEIAADEFFAMLAIEEAQDQYERECVGES